MKYPKCYSDNPETATYCTDCGTQIPTSNEINAAPTKALETPVKELVQGTDICLKI